MTELNSEPYPYGAEFQKALLSVAVQDPGFLIAHKDILAVKLFDDPVLQCIAGILTNYHNQYSIVPSYEVCSQLVTERLSQANTAIQSQAERYYQVVYSLYTQEIPDAGWVRDRAVRFAQRGALKTALSYGIECLRKDGDIAEVQELLDKAATIGVYRDLGVDLFEMVDQIPQIWNEQFSQGGRIPTPFPWLTTATYGGPRRGELYMIQGIPKVGKSAILINIAACALRLGFRVLHITIGDLKEFDVCLRYCCNFTGYTIEQVVYSSNPTFFSSIKGQILKPNQIRIKYFSPFSLTVPQLRSYISWLRSAHGFEADLLIVDYPDKMHRNDENSYAELGRIYMEIKGILDTFNMVGWIASQSNRDAANKQDNRARNVAESWDKIANVDGAIPVSQTDDERAKQQMRLFVEMLRFGQDHFTIPCDVNYGTCQICQKASTIFLPVGVTT